MNIGDRFAFCGVEYVIDRLDHEETRDFVSIKVWSPGAHFQPFRFPRDMAEKLVAERAAGGG